MIEAKEPTRQYLLQRTMRSIGLQAKEITESEVCKFAVEVVIRHHEDGHKHGQIHDHLEDEGAHQQNSSPLAFVQLLKWANWNGAIGFGSHQQRPQLEGVIVFDVVKYEQYGHGRGDNAKHL